MEIRVPSRAPLPPAWIRRAILLGPVAKVPELRPLLRRIRIGAEDLLVGVDGGLSLWKKLGYRPHLAVGDWDSLKERGLLEEVASLSLPQAKDQSDLSFALRAALHLGVKEIVGLGLTEGRPDHHLAGLFECAGFLRDLPKNAEFRALSLLGAEAEYRFASGGEISVGLELAEGELFSVFALGGSPRGAQGVSITGGRYPLRDEVLMPGSRGLSNEGMGEPVEIRVKQGQLVVVTKFK